MGKPTGFIEWQRLLPRARPIEERLGDFCEIAVEQPPEQTRQQAGRCMDCGVPFCMSGCPLGNPIPDFNDLIYQGRYREAYLVLSATNDFPELTGRLCPAPCEASCTLSINQDPVTIEQVEKQIIERAFAEGWVTPRPPAERSGKRVAVVGSGPAGLAAASQLNRMGHHVVIYERADRIGGLLRYGIPDFKLEKHVLDRRLRILEAEGIELAPGVDVGGTGPSWAELRDRHDALLIAIGSRRPRDLDVPGRDLPGVVWAMDFLEGQNRAGAGDAVPPIDAAGKHVVILGGGDTGSDCLGTALRQRAASVRQIELLPRPPDARRASNPWPEWPLVFRTSSSHAEGGERDFALMTTRLEGSAKLEKLCATRVELARGKLVPTGGELELPVDLLILAMGFVGSEAGPLVEQLGLALDERGNIATHEYATAVPGVFAAGDARRGQSLIVWAIHEGREAAAAIDRYLSAV